MEMFIFQRHQHIDVFVALTQDATGMKKRTEKEEKKLEAPCHSKIRKKKKKESRTIRR
jgi:hypothetical protein